MTKKILVVDDDTDILYTIKNGLSSISKSYDVVIVESGEECLRMLENGIIPDVILLDIMMPNMDGWETYDFIKQSNDWANIPIVFITALDDEKTLERGIKTDAFCLRKPFQISQLKEILDSVFGRF